MQKLNIDEMKKIAYEIIKSENKRYSMRIDVFPVTYAEYFKDNILHKNYSLQKKIFLAKEAKNYGINVRGDTIFIFLDTIKLHVLSKYSGINILELVETCFHEARHTAQITFNKFSYEGFLLDLEKTIINSFPEDYVLNHNKYSNEIGANLYGVAEAKKYLQKNYPEVYENHKNTLECREILYRYNYLTYDAVDTVDRFFNIIKKENISPLATDILALKIFFYQDNSLKKIKDIIYDIKNNKDYKYLDKKVIYIFMSSQYFWQNINVQELSDEELNLLKESLEYTNQVYQNQEKTVEQAYNTKITNKFQFLKNQKSILKKLANINKFTDKIIDTVSIQKRIDVIKTGRNEKKRNQHISGTEDNLKKVTNELSQRHR